MSIPDWHTTEEPQWEEENPNFTPYEEEEEEIEESEESEDDEGDWEDS